MKKYFFLFLISLSIKSFAQVWQWSVSVDSVMSDETKGHPTAFLWIPENCKQVRGVVVGQHNMIEKGIFEHPAFRKTMNEIDFAIVWVSPMFNINFDFNKEAGVVFNCMMKKLADSSGYKELEFVPVVPVGHSAAATYPWNFAAWNPQRTLAVISVHGDAPQTKLTGYGGANVVWRDKNIDGVPGLFIMGEYEWWEERITPGFDYVSKHPMTPITFFCDAGHGHFDYSDALVNYLALYIRKAASCRLPKVMPLDRPVQLKFVDPANGWLMDRWRIDSLPIAVASPYKTYKGNRYYSSWCFDKEMCDAAEKSYAKARRKKQQNLGFIQNGEMVKPDKSHANYSLKFIPESDGITFHLKAFFADSSRTIAVNGHAKTALHIKKITGPVKKVNDSTFQICFDKTGFNNSKRSNDIWLAASNEGDDKYKSIVQQANLRFPLWNKDGKKQRITFKVIPDQKEGIKSVQLNAISDADAPVHFYVKEGPAEVDGSELRLTKIPTGAKFPVRVTIVAWQYGRNTQPKLQTAQPVEQTFYIIRS